MSRFYFTDEGSGNPLVFIHGYCESHTVWSAFVKPFTKSFRVICLDLPGFGRSEMPIGDFSIGDIARAVWDLLTRLDIDTCFVVGHSLGGYVTLEMADQHPNRLSGFCMFHSTAYADDAPKKLNRTKVMEFVAKNGTPPFVQTLIPSLFATPKHAVLESLLLEASQISPLTVIGYARAMRDRPDRTQVYATFPNPILFFAGMKDSIIPLESIWKQSEIAHHKVVHELAGTAHMGIFEASMETQKVLLDFLEEVH